MTRWYLLAEWIAMTNAFQLKIQSVLIRDFTGYVVPEMVAVSIDRLDRYYTRERGNPKRVYHELIVPDVDFEAIREAVRRALHLN